MKYSNLRLKLLGAAVVALFSASFASAVPVIFNFDGSGGLASSYNFSSGALSVTVTAASWDGSSWRSAQVGRYNGGLGVTNSSGNDSGSPQHAVDNNGWDDYLILQFSAPVDVASVQFGWVNNDSDFKYWIGNSLGAVRTTAGGTAVNGGSSPGTYGVNAGNAVGTYFSIAAGSGSSDYFKVKKLTVDYTTSVPEHGSTAALVGVAMVGLVALRKRTRR